MPIYVPTQKKPQAIDRLEDITDIDVSREVKKPNPAADLSLLQGLRKRAFVPGVVSTTNQASTLALSTAQPSANDAVTLIQTLSDAYKAIRPNQIPFISPMFLGLALLANTAQNVLAETVGVMVHPNTFRGAFNDSMHTQFEAQVFHGNGVGSPLTLKDFLATCAQNVTLYFQNATIGNGNLTVSHQASYTTFGVFGNKQHQLTATSNVSVFSAFAAMAHERLSCIVNDVAKHLQESDTSVWLKRGGIIALAALAVVAVVGCLVAASIFLAKRMRRSGYGQIQHGDTTNLLDNPPSGSRYGAASS